MTDNSKQIIEAMQASFPHIYNVYDKKTVLYAILSVIGERYGARTDIIDRLYAMIGIDSTYDEDLEHRWGSLLGIRRQNNESYDNYRSRLKIIYSSLAGGTAEAIKYAIASAINITAEEDIINQYIKVYDAWEYPYEAEDINKSYGNIVCTVDLQINDTASIMHDKIMDAINTTKASGIYPYLLFIYTANELAPISVNEYADMKITTDVADDINIDISDNTNDMASYDIINERCAVGGIKTRIWSKNGTNTNTAVLNSTFMTNILMEADEYTDIIVGPAIIGEAVVGTMVIGQSEL